MYKLGRKWTLLTVLLLVFVMLATACGTGNSSNQSETTASTASVSTTATQETQPKLDPVTISWFQAGTEQKDQALVLAEMNKYLSEKIKATLNMTYADFGSYKQKKDLMIAGGDTTDIFFNGDWTGYFNDAAIGALKDITDLMKQNAPKTTEQLTTLFKGAYIDAVTVKGKVYGIPATKDAAQSYGFMVRKDLLDKYNLDTGVIKKPEDMAQFYEVIKKNEPGIIPYIAANKGGGNPAWGVRTDLIGGGFGGVVFGSTDYKVVDDYTRPEYLTALKMLRDWNLKGYINKDAATLQDAAPVIKEGKVFSFFTSLKPGMDKDTTNANGYPFVQIETSQPKMNTSSLSNSIECINANSKNPERALMFLELVNTDVYFNNLLNFGIEGTHYTKVGDNVIDFASGLTPQTSPYNPQQGWSFGNQYINYIMKGDDPNKWQTYQQFNESAAKSPILGFSYDATPVKSETAAVQAAAAKYTNALNGGLLDIDKDMPKIEADLKAAGLDKILAEKQRQLDAWVAANNKTKQ